MLTLFRHEAKKYAYDTVSGSLFPLTTLEYRILEALTPPMASTLPTALRYELAKFDSEAVRESYAGLYEKYRNGAIFAEETGTLSVPDSENEALVCAAVLAAFEKTYSPRNIHGSLPAELSEMLNQKGRSLPKRKDMP